MTKPTNASLIQKLGYKFKDKTLLTRALTHRSFGEDNNERLEFLGDALLGLIIAEYLFAHYPDMSEGKLSRLRANLVNGEVLASLCRELMINQFLNLGQGEIKNGGIKRRSILANCFEAMIGAIYLDGGMDICEKTVLNWYADRLTKVRDEGPKKDPKSILQEYLQSKKMQLPHYSILRTGGKEHNQIFQVQCEVKDMSEKTQGEGTSRRRAEQEAAQKFLTKIHKKASK